MEDIRQRDRPPSPVFNPKIAAIQLFSILNLLFTSTRSMRMTWANLRCEVWLFMAMKIRVFRLPCHDAVINLRRFEAAYYFHFQLLLIFIPWKIN